MNQNMKKVAVALLAIVTLGALRAQEPVRINSTDPMEGDTAIAASIINNYLSLIDFEHLLTDSVLYVKSSVVERSHSNDTITILRWYGNRGQNRIEMWQKGKLNDAYYGDGRKLFRRFSETYRQWRNVSQMSYYDLTMPLDIRGALYNWRSKGSEAYYQGQYTYNEHPVWRVFVASPSVYDRNYFFERETGLLFLVTEEDHIYGNDKVAVNAQKVDWRAWHEFSPFHGVLLPTMESYQVDGQLFIIHHEYELLPKNNTYFTENVYTP